jgi:PAS domain S-box-containing protein
MISRRSPQFRFLVPQSRDSTPMRYAFAAGCCIVAFASRVLLDPLLKDQAPLLLFTMAVAVSAARGGFGPGLFSTLLGIFGIEYFFPPKGTFVWIAPEYLPAAARQIGAFLVVGIILSWLGGALRRVRWEALGLAAQRNDILESITDGFFSLDAEGRFVYLNTVTAQLVGSPRDELIGKRLWEETPQLRGGIVERTFRQVADQHVAANFEYQSTASKRWFEIRAHPVANNGLTVYFQDVSGRKLAELHLRETLAERDAALERVRLLSGLLPICAACKKIRNDDGDWQQLESYISQHSQAKFSHGMCPECGKQYYGELWPEPDGTPT